MSREPVFAQTSPLAHRLCAQRLKRMGGIISCCVVRSFWLCFFCPRPFVWLLPGVMKTLNLAFRQRVASSSPLVMSILSRMPRKFHKQERRELFKGSTRHRYIACAVRCASPPRACSRVMEGFTRPRLNKTYIIPTWVCTICCPRCEKDVFALVPPTTHTTEKHSPIHQLSPLHALRGR